LDFIEPEIAPFDPLTPKTLDLNQTWSGSDTSFARYLPLNYSVTFKLGLGITQGHIAAYWSKITTPIVFDAPVGGEAIRFTKQTLVTKKLE